MQYCIGELFVCWSDSSILYSIRSFHFLILCVVLMFRTDVFFFGWVFFRVFFNVCAPCIVLTLVNLGCQNIVCNILYIFSLLLIVFVQA